MPVQEKNEYGKPGKTQRAEGDRFLFWVFSLFIGTGAFFLLYLSSNLSRDASLLDLFTDEFWTAFGWMCVICFVADYLGKGVAYGVIQWCFKDPTATFWELNHSSIKSFLTHLLEVALRAMIFLVGAINVLRNELFASDSLWSLVGTYLVVKVCIYVMARLLTGAAI